MVLNTLVPLNAHECFHALGSRGESLEGRERRRENMGDFDYENLLDRARENIPEEISSRSRWRLPAPQIMIEGSNTIFRNFNEVVSMICLLYTSPSPRDRG